METHSTTTSGQRNTVVGEGQEEGDSRTNRSNVTINSKSVNRNSKLLQRLKLKDAMKNLSRFEDLAGQLDAVSIQKEDMVSEMTDSIKSGLRVLFKIEEETANYHNRLKDYRESVFYVYRGIRDDPEECLLREFSQLCKYSENIARVRRTIEERDCNFRGVNMNREAGNFLKNGDTACSSDDENEGSCAQLFLRSSHYRQIIKNGGKRYREKNVTQKKNVTQ